MWKSKLFPIGVWGKGLKMGNPPSPLLVEMTNKSNSSFFISPRCFADSWAYLSEFLLSLQTFRRKWKFIIPSLILSAITFSWGSDIDVPLFLMSYRQKHQRGFFSRRGMHYLKPSAVKSKTEGKWRFSRPISIWKIPVMLNLRAYAFSGEISYHPLPWSPTWKIEKYDAIKVSVH